MLICPSRNVCSRAKNCKHARPHIELDFCLQEICVIDTEEDYMKVVCVDEFIEIVKEKIHESERNSSNH